MLLANDEAVSQLRNLALQMRAAIMQGMHAETASMLATVVGERGGDTIFRLDEHGEAALLEFCARWAEKWPFLLVAEGLADGQRIFPAHADPAHLAFTLIVDPIDGTRGLMYGKRSAWTLLAIAPPPHAGWHPTLANIVVALQAELPTSRAALADLLWAIRGEGAHGETLDLRTGEITTFVPLPSRATTLVNGFATIVKFFPGGKTSAAQIEEQLYASLYLGDGAASVPIFEDEYICSGGELYELIVGHDRFIADLRPLLPATPPYVKSLSAHPYDLCTALIAVEAGVIIVDHEGNPLHAPLDTATPVTWIGYANQTLYEQIQPQLAHLLMGH